MNTARKILRNFYDQVRLSPDLLCLNCVYMSWSGVGQHCSAARRKDCLFFVNDMLNWLETETKDQRARRPAPRLSGRRP